MARAKKADYMADVTAQLETIDNATAAATGAIDPNKNYKMTMIFPGEIYDYIKVMSRVTGCNMTELVNTILLKHMDSHRELYDQAINFKNQL